MKTITFIIAFVLLPAFYLQAQTTTNKISITKLIAYEKDNRFFIDWATEPGVEDGYWEVQQSVDGKRFSTLALVLGADPRKTGEQFEYKGKINTTNPACYYRVVHFSSQGSQQKSEIIRPLKDCPYYTNPDVAKDLQVHL